jgi:hypothetical protein
MIIGTAILPQAGFQHVELVLAFEQDPIRMKYGDSPCLASAIPSRMPMTMATNGCTIKRALPGPVSRAISPASKLRGKRSIGI